MTKINQKAGDLATEAPLKKARKTPIKPSDISPDKVQELAGLGLTMEQAAVVLNCSKRTLCRHFDNEWKIGMETANVAVIKNLYRMATSKGPEALPASIFWTKARCGWSEKARLELSMDLPEDYDEVKKRYAQLVEVRARALIKQGAIELPTDETAPVETNAQPVPPAETMGAPVELDPAPRTRAKVF